MYDKIHYKKKNAATRKMMSGVHITFLFDSAALD